ncbi:MAG: alpha/beta fold hydrolase [Chloroflexota bacterium]
MTKKKSSRSGCLARIGRIFLWLVIILTLLLAAGYIYQRQTTAADFEQFPAPGQRVDVGGYSLHIHCMGEGSPTVIVDAGNGDFSLGWSGVQPEVAKFARICTYDRAGYGWSDPSPKPRTAEAMAEELHTLLSNTGIEPPYVLVGHSLGGYNVRMFADLYPNEVAGMVLVDAGHEDQLNRFPPEYAKLNQQQVSYLSVMGFMSRFGILRAMGNSSGGADFAPPQVLKMPKDIQPLYMAMMSHPAYFDATLGELQALTETTDQLRATHTLGDLPLIVLTAESTLDAAALQSIGMPADFDTNQIQQVWLELQAELAALSTNSEHIVVKDSAHAIQLDQPQAVIDAIRKVVGMAMEEK